MADKIRVGIVGATVTPGGSGWGANAHVPALQALPGYELKAVCTAHEDTAQASAEKFGAALAFHDMDAMVAHPDIDLVAVVVRVPLHNKLITPAIRAGKPVCCEWPLGAHLADATAMAEAAKGRPSLVGLQAQSDPAVMYARDLVAGGEIGDIVSVNARVIVGAVTERGDGRIWQGRRENGANPMTIPGGHSIDALCHILGDEFAEVAARVTTRIDMWKHAVTGADYPVDAPDTVSAAGVMKKSGAEVAYQVASVPHNASGTCFEIYGRKGTLVLTSKSVNIGPSRLQLAIGKDELKEAAPPAKYTLIPADMAAGPGRNVGQAYARFAAALQSGSSDAPDFADAVRRHALIDAMERSHNEGRAIKLG